MNLKTFNPAGGILVFLALIWSMPAFSQGKLKQGPPVPVTFCVDSAESTVYHLINDFRKTHSLNTIPLSRSLSYVADLHARDLYLNHPDKGSCNAHSWSDKGFWTPFCYPGDEGKRSVWDKPIELTRYPSKAHEIVYWENNPLNAEGVVDVLKSEEYFREFLLNRGKWLGKTWNAIGIGIYENYACVWFGETKDPDGVPVVCGSVAVTPSELKPPSPAPAATGDQPPSTVTSRDSLAIQYYIIVKTNLSAEETSRFMKILAAEGYADASVLTFDGKVRISVYQTEDRARATARLREVKKRFHDAWLLKR